MAVTATPVFVQNPKSAGASTTNSDSANTKKTLVTGGSNGSKVVSVMATSTETANARVAQLWLTHSGTSYLLGSVNVPVNSGFDGSAVAVNLMNLTSMPGLPVDNDGQPYILVIASDTLQVSFTTQLASGKEIDVVAIYGDF